MRANEIQPARQMKMIKSFFPGKIRTRFVFEKVVRILAVTLCIRLIVHLKLLFKVIFQLGNNFLVSIFAKSELIQINGYKGNASTLSAVTQVPFEASNGLLILGMRDI